MDRTTGQRGPRYAVARGVLLGLAAYSFVPSVARAGQEPFDPAAIDAIFAVQARDNGPGCAVAVAQSGTTLFEHGYGLANLDHRVPITPETVFDVASVTKQFGAASAIMLELDGVLSLDDDVRRWIPELPAYERPITVRDLIHHTGGLRDYLNLMPLSGREYYQPITHQYIADLLSRQREPVFSAGDYYLYSNSGYMMLALTIERASGQTFADYAHEHIFAPLGMTSSFLYSDRERIVPHRAHGYAAGDNGWRMVHNYDFAIPGDGQLYTTVQDLIRWTEYLHGEPAPPLRETMLTSGQLRDGRSTGYGGGLVLAEHRGLATASHSGSTWGFGSHVVRFVEPELTVAVACNNQTADPAGLAYATAEAVLGDLMDQPAEANDARGGSQEAPAEPVAVSSALAQALAGDYDSVELGTYYRISVDGSRLVMQIAGAGSGYEITAGDGDALRTELPFWGGRITTTLRLQRNDAGTITGFLLDSGSERNLIFVRR